ncbi:MAG: Major virion structural protein [uncultured bacterium]|nr:MAG: Major virion structural protein [uncultured bacterium]
MSRLTEALISGAYTRDLDKPILDLKLGGQQGWTPNLAEWVSNQAYVSRPLTCILLEAPKLFTIMPDSQKWIASLKSLFELHARTIDGFNAGLKVDVDEHSVGGAGEMQQEFTNVTRERSTPKFTFVEKYGRPTQTLIDYWIRYGMMDPETKFALAGTLGSAAVTDLLADWYSATCLFFVPDPLHKKVDKAWITTNMFPLGTGDIVGKRDLTTAQEILTLDIEFTGISQYGLGIQTFAQSILDNINTLHADPFMKPSFVQGVSADVDAVDRGTKKWTEEVGRVSVTNMTR